MKNFFKNLLYLIILLGMVYVFRDPLRSEWIPAWGNFLVKIFQKSPCVEPIPYNIGTFDTRFNISEKYFLEAMAQAESLWEKPYGKELFVYEPDNNSKFALKVNLIYDYRQETTSKLGSIGVVLKDNRESYDELKSKFNELKDEYEKSRAEFNARVADFNNRKAAYESEVRAWNKKGGASREEYSRLEKERVNLEKEWQGLQGVQSDLNNQADQLNALVVEINRLASILNLSVEKYNAANSARGESFDEGVYSTNGFSRKIDIYEFSSKDKLVRVLAHELGHALGLEHVDDKSAIMYELNEGNNVAINNTDLKALRDLCGVK